MTSMGLGAAKRHAINETVRLRMAALLPVVDEPGGGAALGGPAPGGVPGGPAPGAVPGGLPGAGGGASSDPSTPADPSELLAIPETRAGARLRFGSATALDRRAVAGLALLLLFAVGYAVQHFWLARPQAVAVPALSASPAAPAFPASPPLPGPGSGSGPGASVSVEPAPGSGAPGAPAALGPEAVVVVDIGGRVHVPGLHTLPGGSRVADALRAAGGPLPEADTRSLNLARVLTDGEQILVGEPASAAAPGGAGTGPQPAITPRPPVSLNRATLEQLDTLPGVGPTLAQRILAYRTSHGSFRTLDQLRQVSGIGARTFAELRPLLTL
ncbi:helix-hairpin-helix domain-containing protein [Kitasatospora sp. NPDC097643]|uniref:helix-hairpin-helix domain-containing protein n=1 Tax=Kitasatospora sp. NPDC097643 TaxID=3157230 RepID=UPI003333B964